MLSNTDVVIPRITVGTHIAELAADGLGAEERIAGDDARLPVVLALRAREGSLVKFIVIAELTGANW